MSVLERPPDSIVVKSTVSVIRLLEFKSWLFFLAVTKCQPMSYFLLCKMKIMVVPTLELLSGLNEIHAQSTQSTTWPMGDNPYVCYYPLTQIWVQGQIAHQRQPTQSLST